MASSTAAEVEDTIARIKSHKGVEGVVIMTKEGEIFKFETNASSPNQYYYMMISSSML